jgi:hypothetical protein
MQPNRKFRIMKPRLSQRLTDLFAACVGRGAPLERAASIAGVEPKTARAWIAMGSGDVDAQSATGRFARAVRAARARYAEKIIRRLTHHIAGTKTMAARTIRRHHAWLEREYPELFGSPGLLELRVVVRAGAMCNPLKGTPAHSTKKRVS